MQGIFFNNFPNAHIPEIYKEIYLEKVYAQYFAGKENLTILDLGANIGLFSFYAYPFASKIYAIEPALMHQNALKEMISYNKYDKITPLQLAVSHKNGEATFFHPDNVTAWSLRPELNMNPGDTEIVKTITLDKLFTDNHIEHVDFMKVDIEGAEGEVFGSEGFDLVAKKIDLIIGEFHIFSGLNPKQFESYFLDRGFNFKWLNKTDATVFAAERIK